ncbi:30S ribosomal protein S6 [candidate division WOR-3 bacterium]|nr:30S ribosomal protein S6 [candidate division WOR-3 bacterium]TET98984.1 MAG: 30S ribosomal protein S6 [Candidatus Stahlbacteria bacterium]
MKKYECTFIVKPEKEEEIDGILDKVNSFIEKKKGKVDDVDKWGLRKLAYTVKGYEDGYYTVMSFGFIPEKINLLNDFMKKNSNIIRYLIVSKEE